MCTSVLSYLGRYGPLHVLCLGLTTWHILLEAKALSTTTEPGVLVNSVGNLWTGCADSSLHAP